MLLKVAYLDFPKNVLALLFEADIQGNMTFFDPMFNRE